MNISTSMVVIGPDGKVVQKLSSDLSLPTGFILPEGHILSWRTVVFGDNDQTRVIRFNSAVILLEPKSANSVCYHASIECKDVADFSQALDLFAQAAGGTVQIRTAISEQSFIRGLRNDLLRLWVKMSSLVRRIRQRIGWRIARN